MKSGKYFGYLEWNVESIEMPPSRYPKEAASLIWAKLSVQPHVDHRVLLFSSLLTRYA